MEDRSIWKEELSKVKQCIQRQDSLLDQLKDLAIIANKFGFYDAADYIREKFMIKFIPLPEVKENGKPKYKCIYTSTCQLQHFSSLYNCNICVTQNFNCMYLGENP